MEDIMKIEIKKVLLPSLISSIILFVLGLLLFFKSVHLKIIGSAFSEGMYILDFNSEHPYKYCIILSAISFK